MRSSGPTVAVAVVFAACVSVCASCTADSRTRSSSPIELHVIAPKGLLSEADSVTLDVWQSADCKGPDVVTTAGSTRLGDPHPLIKPGSPNNTCSAGGAGWCVSFSVLQDPATKLAWSITGTVGGKKTFRGCTVRAVDQDPLSIAITVVRVIEGVVCGDGIVGATETCDPAGASDEACDAATCQTKEVAVSNGTGAQSFYRGLPARKTGVSLRWLDDGKLFSSWSDAATGGVGADGKAEITWRRLSPDVTTDTTTTILRTELRLQSTAGFDPNGSKKRSGVSLAPSVAPLAGSEAGSVLVVFARTPPGEASHVFGSVQRTNLGRPDAVDFVFATTAVPQESPASAATPAGDVLVAWVESATIRTALRKSGGAISAPQTVSSSGTNATPTVAALGADFVVAWHDGDDVKMRTVGADGTPKGTELVVNATRRAGKQDQPAVAGLPSGEFLVAFRSTGGDGDTGSDIRAQRFDGTGNPVGDEIATTLNETNVAGDQVTPAVAAGTNGGGKFYWVAWADQQRSQIGGRIVAAAGGFLFNNVTGGKGEFDVALTARALSSPAVAVGGGTPAHVAVAFADDVDGDPAADDDRVKIRRFPLPVP